MAYLAKGELDRAAGEFMLTADILKETGDKMELARLLYEQGLFLRVKGDTARARGHLEKAMFEFKVMGLQLWAEKCRKALAGLVTPPL
jgi:hypothetical protein